MELLTSIEFWGNITGLLCVILAAREKMWSYPFGIANVILFIFMFYEVRLYADVTLQLIFLVLTIMGWIVWSRGEKNSKQVRKTRRMTKREVIATVIGVLALTPVLGYLYSLIGAAVPFVDSFILVASLFAQWFLSQKVIENWMIWFVVDAVAIPLYFVKGLEMTSILYLIFLLNTIHGYYSWTKVMKQEGKYIDQGILSR